MGRGTIEEGWGEVGAKQDGRTVQGHSWTFFLKMTVWTARDGYCSELVYMDGELMKEQ